MDSPLGNPPQTERLPPAVRDRLQISHRDSDTIKHELTMLIYLDNCCFNRPYDDQSHANIFLETQAKLGIQENSLSGKYQLVWSYILQYENDQNPYINHKHESLMLLIR
ncbi:MAG: hypothetical protein PHD43_01305 [Methylococcales bacterium]|nr:hypothetical protein [Methylococcales bacterium]